MSKSLTTYIIALIIFIATYFINRKVQKIITNTASIKKIDPTTTKVIQHITFFSIYTLNFLLILSHFDAKIIYLFESIGFFAVLLTFAFQNAITNTIAGLFLLYGKQYAVGDYIKVLGEQIDVLAEGTIIEIRLRRTVVEHNGYTTYIPNNLVNGKVVSVKQKTTSNSL